jgi:hypothetical protein
VHVKRRKLDENDSPLVSKNSQYFFHVRLAWLKDSVTEVRAVAVDRLQVDCTFDLCINELNSR